ncbi:MAG: hypothetical protein KGM47_16045, partial [Acidobacteriota bacterium]|nr:hypothetical protein [Acidobacteriota bacterium]
MKSSIDPALEEVAALDIFDANVRVGHSGIHGDLALEAPELIAEMDRFGIRQGLVSHFASEEYDVGEGNRALAECAEAHADRLVPAWAALPDDASIRALAERRPRAVRLSPSVHRHNFSASSWCSGELFDYLQQNSILALIAREDV